MIEFLMDRRLPVRCSYVRIFLSSPSINPNHKLKINIEKNLKVLMLAYRIKSKYYKNNKLVLGGK